MNKFIFEIKTLPKTIPLLLKALVLLFTSVVMLPVAGNTDLPMWFLDLKLEINETIDDLKEMAEKEGLEYDWDKYYV